MTYCVAASISAGIVFASDSRTNAGVDNIAVFSKMNVFEVPGERVIVMLSAGNLAMTQSVVSLLRMETRKSSSVLAVNSMHSVAMLVGETARRVGRRDGPSLRKQGIDASCTFIVGGQIKGEPPRLFRTYSQGNFIETTHDTTYFQIGETKYGKPIIDRVVRFDTPIKDVAKCLLVSFDSTMRSNLSVGLPIDLLGYEADALRVTLRRRFDQDDVYFRNISQIWSAGLRKAFAEVPDVNWSQNSGSELKVVNN